MYIGAYRIIKNSEKVENELLMEALVSIIVPIYNKEKYLKECLKSIETQSYSNIEILLIDDGSTDSSLLICEEHKKQIRELKFLQRPMEAFLKHVIMDFVKRMVNILRSLIQMTILI